MTKLNLNLIKHSFLAGCYYKDKHSGVAEEYLWDSYQKTLLKDEQEEEKELSNLNNWQKYPENKPTDGTADFIVAIHNPKVSRKHNTTAPAYYQIRAMWLSDSFISLEGDNYFIDKDVAYFLQTPPIPNNITEN